MALIVKRLVTKMDWCVDNCETRVSVIQAMIGKILFDLCCELVVQGNDILHYFVLGKGFGEC